MPVLTAFALLLSLALPLAAQNPNRPLDMAIDASVRTRVIDGVLGRLNEGYVFPQMAAEMERAVRALAQRGAYDSIVSARAFAGGLTRDLQAVSRDRHLEVTYARDGVLDEPPDQEPPLEARRKRAVFARRVNYGFQQVGGLAGNVGYLEIRSFDFDASAVDSTLAAAMTFLANTDALIIDVRRNGGGDPLMVAAVCSYLLPSNTLINKFYWRPQNRWDEFRTTAVSGRHYGTDRPVYVLTSKQTFSGAEEFAYDLQTQGRGKVVGDTTGGGAHPGGMRRVDEHFGIWIPSGRAVNPRTGTNWEGIGIRPDIPVPAAEALRTAHLRALEGLLAAQREPERQAQLRQALEEVRRS